LLGKFIDKSFNVVQRLRVRSPGKLLTSPGARAPPVKNHCAS